jgi:hypothetical protein
MPKLGAFAILAIAAIAKAQEDCAPALANCFALGKYDLVECCEGLSCVKLNEIYGQCRPSFSDEVPIPDEILQTTDSPGDPEDFVDPQVTDDPEGPAEDPDAGSSEEEPTDEDAPVEAPKPVEDETADSPEPAKGDTYKVFEGKDYLPNSPVPKKLGVKVRQVFCPN